MTTPVQQLMLNGHKLYVESHGNGNRAVLVLLHHGLGTVRAWKAQIPALVEAGFRVIVYDRWGYGRSDPRPSLDAPTFGSDVADLAALLETLQLPEVVLVGHSDGGTIALYYAVRYPEHVKALVLVAAHVMVEPRMVTALTGVQTAFEQDSRFRQGLQRVHGDRYREVYEHWISGWQRTENQTWDMRPLLEHVTCPALVIQGEEDEHATAQHAHTIADGVRDARLWLVPSAGHMLPQDNAELFNNRLIEFILEKG